MASEQHFPKGTPRGRLRSHPLLCPLTGKQLLGAACIGGACPYADETCGFVDCAKINEEQAAASFHDFGNASGFVVSSRETIPLHERR